MEAAPTPGVGPERPLASLKPISAGSAAADEGQLLAVVEEVMEATFHQMGTGEGAAVVDQPHRVGLPEFEIGNELAAPAVGTPAAEQVEDLPGMLHQVAEQPVDRSGGW